MGWHIFYNPRFTPDQRIMNLTDFAPTFSTYIERMDVPANCVGQARPAFEKLEDEARAYILSILQKERELNLTFPKRIDRLPSVKTFLNFNISSFSPYSSQILKRDGNRIREDQSPSNITDENVRHLWLQFSTLYNITSNALWNELYKSKDWLHTDRKRYSTLEVILHVIATVTLLFPVLGLWKMRILDLTLSSNHIIKNLIYSPILVLVLLIPAIGLLRLFTFFPFSSYGNHLRVLYCYAESYYNAYNYLKFIITALLTCLMIIQMYMTDYRKATTHEKLVAYVKIVASTFLPHLLLFMGAFWKSGKNDVDDSTNTSDMFSLLLRGIPLLLLVKYLIAATNNEKKRAYLSSPPSLILYFQLVLLRLLLCDYCLDI